MSPSFLSYPTYSHSYLFLPVDSDDFVRSSLYDSRTYLLSEVSISLLPSPVLHNGTNWDILTPVSLRSHFLSLLGRPYSGSKVLTRYSEWFDCYGFLCHSGYVETLKVDLTGFPYILTPGLQVLKVWPLFVDRQYSVSRRYEHKYPMFSLVLGRFFGVPLRSLHFLIVL